MKLQKLASFYDNLHERKVKCMKNLKTQKQLVNEVNAIKQTLLEQETLTFYSRR